MNILLPLIFILIGAKIGGFVAEKLKQPAVLGELLTGVVIGPVLGIISTDELISAMGKLGIVILMFLAGMHIDLERFKKLLESGSVVALCGVAVPFTLGVLLGLYMGWDLYQSLFLGGILTPTSVSITTRTLAEMKKLRTKAGVIILDAAVVDDILGILILTVLLATVKPGFNFFNFIIVFLEIVAFFFIVIKFGKKLVPNFLKFGRYLDFRVKEGLFSLVLALIFFFSLVANSIGLSLITGAFLLGLITPRNRLGRVEHELYALGYGFLIPIFFVYAGTLIDISVILPFLPLILLILFVAFLSKIAGCFVGSLPYTRSIKESLIIGIGMVPRLEVAIVIAEIGRNSGFISGTNFSIITTVLALTVFITPLFLKALMRWKIRS